MNCKLCKSGNIEEIYNGPIRIAMMIGYSEESVAVYQCNECGVFWHEYKRADNHYESVEYRAGVDGSSDIEQYYKLHDSEVLPKLKFTGTGIFRNKIVADIGCGGGSFLDFVKGSAKETIAVEPSLIYRRNLTEKGHKVYGYIDEAIYEYANKVDIVTTFDVIEHIMEPVQFCKGINNLLHDGGKVIIGTPSEYPLLRKLVGKNFDKFIFQANHPWIFSERSLINMLKEASFSNIEVEQKYRFGIGNFINWLKEEIPCGDVQYDFISETLSKTWQKEMISNNLGEYFVAYANK